MGRDAGGFARWFEVSHLHDMSVIAVSGARYRTCPAETCPSAGDEVVEGAADVLRRQPDVPHGPVVAEEDEPALLVTLERGPRALAIDADRLRLEHLLDDRCRLAGETERRKETQRDRATVRHALVAGGRFERVGERVAEVEDRALARLARVAQAHRRLERGAAPHALVVGELPERLA